jgi:adenylate cyclase
MNMPYFDAANARQLFINLTDIAKGLGRGHRVRSMSLRLVAVLGTFAIILIGNGDYRSDRYIAAAIVYSAAYMLSGALALIYRWTRPLRSLVLLDAMLVTYVLSEHILGAAVTDNHGLTTSGLVIAFIFLSHIGMTLNGRLIAMFSAMVLTAWITMLGLMALRHNLTQPGTLFTAFFDLDLGLALSFGFAALSTYLLAIDHDRTRREALKIDQWRHNLARFFPRSSSQTCRRLATFLI